jgi:hypothetical protein
LRSFVNGNYDTLYKEERVITYSGQKTLHQKLFAYARQALAVDAYPITSSPKAFPCTRPAPKLFPSLEVDNLFIDEDSKALEEQQGSNLKFEVSESDAVTLSSVRKIMPYLKRSMDSAESNIRLKKGQKGGEGEEEERGGLKWQVEAVAPMVEWIVHIGRN